MRNIRFLMGLVSFVAVAVAAQITYADPVKSAGPIQITMGNWTLTPQLSDGDVEGFLAILAPGTEVGDNLTAVWYKKESNDTYTTWAWETQSRANAIAWLKQSKSLNGDSDKLWGISAFNAISSPTAPSEIRNGVFLTDPFSASLETMTEAEKQAFLDLLAAAGWRVSTVEAGMEVMQQNCDPLVVVRAIEVGVEIYADGGGDGEAAAYASISDWWCQNIGICVPWTWTISGPTVTGCTTTGWTITSGPVWNQIHCSVHCTYDVTVTCTYTRTRKRRLANCNTCTWTETATITGGTAVCSSDIYYGDTGCVAPVPLPACPGPSCVTPQNVDGDFSAWTGTPPC